MTAEQWHLDRCGSAIVDGQTVPACHLSEETAHDPRVTLTEAEQEAIWSGLRRARHEEAPIPLAAESHKTHVLWAVSESVEQIIAARLDRVRAVAEQWDTGCSREVLAALDAPQDAPRGPVGGERGAEVAGGQGDAASELRRLHRIGSTPVGQVSTEDAEFYESHPLRDVLGGHARDFRLMVAEWLETR